ncbi:MULTISPECIES: PQQ-like beta-propeller repeat protein [unclassified Arthrobacter]|uniref:PQQ-like beta-propeller repeat protein n=1 Tax=unclassified Arthrobacter TaxID=235627 RepID=UPI001492B5F8|nr:MULTISPECIES: PQQ-like beta-propeller repeat protein [unclassified Arthrobacter]MBE0010587.1 hypothetical protein [Arthrobacter sp. AET 35A]NOJ64398.1 PQQ-like beta-propeller repeat protein [Arthrobacter sp. 147(2020)]
MLNMKPTFALSAAVAAALLLSACSTADPAGSGDLPATAAASAADDATDTDGADRTEVAALSPRAVLTYDGGVMTVDTASGEVLATTEMEGFLRLNNAGDGRHVMVSSTDGFSLFDTGLIVEGHGDHNHYFVSDPVLTDETVDAPEPGHVVVHHGKTALFSDGTGAITVMDSEALSDSEIKDDEVQEYSTDTAHHGVAVPLSGGDLLLTQGTADARNTVQVLAPEGEVIAETSDCPGVHGETAAQPTADGDVVVLGCENGPVVYRDGRFHKVAVEEDYQRSGNLFGHHASSIVLADYKTDPDASLERPTRIGLIDTLADSVTTVDLGSAYWFRSLARGADGEALVLTYDGQLNVLDEETGEVLHQIDVVEPWEEPTEWQLPAPLVKVGADGLAYVTDAATAQLHVVDIAAGTVRDSFDLPETPTELAIVTGDPESPGADDHDHDGDDH